MNKHFFALLASIFLSFTALAQNVIYISYEDVPDRVTSSQIFSVTYKVLITEAEYDTIDYSFAKNKSVGLLNNEPHIRHDSGFEYDTFYFYVKGYRVTIPSLSITITNNDENFTKKIKNKKIKTTSLNPNKKYSHIVANNFVVDEYSTKHYDDKNNILVFKGKITYSMCKNLKFNDIDKQGFESYKRDGFNANITYYLILDKEIEIFKFNYFNIKKSEYVDINIPIVLDDDKVVTQVDLKPKEKSHDTTKMLIVGVSLLLLIMLVIYSRRYYLIVLAIFPIIYLVYMFMPQEEICVKKNSKILLLPMKNSTIFRVLDRKQMFLVEGEIENYKKIKIENEKVGWINNEDLCIY